MVWGALTGFDKCPLVIMPQGKKSVANFVQNVYQGTLSGFYFMHDNLHQFTLMEDGAPIDRSKLPENWAHGMKKLIWFSNSIYLNPIENLWRILTYLLCHCNMPENKEEMIQTIQEVWDEVSLQQLKRLISNMPNCMKAVILAKDGSTRW